MRQIKAIERGNKVVQDTTNVGTETAAALKAQGLMMFILMLQSSVTLQHHINNMWFSSKTLELLETLSSKGNIVLK
ncbi:hypothetical protein SESBI_12801 [Sesbania bispinosa]|nr:hypothetical protein SESBI_12801 [Sesbania bispinosa]